MWGCLCWWESFLLHLLSGLDSEKSKSEICPLSYHFLLHQVQIVYRTNFDVTRDLQITTGRNDKGLKLYDPGYLNTAPVRSSICYIDGDEGILRYRGYPIEELAESSSFVEVAYLLSKYSLVFLIILMSCGQLSQCLNGISFHGSSENSFFPVFPFHRAALKVEMIFKEAEPRYCSIYSFWLWDIFSWLCFDDRSLKANSFSITSVWKFAYSKSVSGLGICHFSAFSSSTGNFGMSLVFDFLSFPKDKEDERQILRISVFWGFSRYSCMSSLLHFVLVTETFLYLMELQTSDVCFCRI